MAYTIAIRIWRPRKIRGHEAAFRGHCANHGGSVQIPILWTRGSHDGLKKCNLSLKETKSGRGLQEAAQPPAHKLLSRKENKRTYSPTNKKKMSDYW